MATLTKELGELAAEAIYNREQKIKEEKCRLRPHLAQQWEMLRILAVEAAKKGNTSYKGTMTLDACKFTVFEPKYPDLNAALPDELKALNKGNGPELTFLFGKGGLAFDLVVNFTNSSSESLRKLKRDRAAAEDKDKEEEFFKEGQKVKD